MAESLTPLIQTLHDSVMVLAPLGWATVTLSFTGTPGNLKLAQLETRGEGTTAPRPKPTLHIEARAEAQRLSEGIIELVERLDGRWAPGKVVVQRTAEVADWRLLRDDGSQAWFTRLERHHLDALLMTDALFDLISGAEKAFHDLQLVLEGRLRRTTGFSYDAPTATLSLRQAEGAPLIATVQVIGQYFTDAFTWAWGWAYEQQNVSSVEGVRRVCAPEVTQPGLSALWRPEVHCDEGFAWALCGAVVIGLGARGVFRAELPDDEGVIFFALMSDPVAR